MNNTAEPQTSRRQGPLRRLLASPAALVSGAVILLIVLVALLAPLLAPHDPAAASLDAVLAPWSPEHPLGGDVGGRDILSRLLHGAQPTLLAGLIAVATAIGVGVPAGLIAGYRGRGFDAVSSWLANALMAMPAIVVLLAVIPSLGNSIMASMVVLGVFIAPGFYRLTRNMVQSVRKELYVDAARVAGLSGARIVFKHILLVVRGPLVVQASLTIGVGITIQAGLEFLGLGDPGTVSWGRMLDIAFTSMSRSPWGILAPGLAIGVTAAVFALFGSALADVLQEDGGSVSRRRRQRASVPQGLAQVSPVPGTAQIPDPPAGTARTTPVEDASDAARPVAASVLLEVEGLRVSYPGNDGAPREVVSDVSFSVRPGEILGLVGESGSGKTQTSFAVLGLLPPEAHVSARRLLLDGADLTRLPERRLRPLRGRTMSYVPQEPMSNLDPTFTIGYQLTQAIRTGTDTGRAAARERALELLARVGISDPAGTMRRYPHEISGGMAQRVLIAASIARKPKLLIADEPTTALDVTIQAEVLSLLRSLRDEYGLGVVLVTHNLGVVADLCDSVAVMQHGRIVERKPVRELFERPEHPYTRLLLGATMDDTAPRAPYRGSEAGR